MTEATTFLTVRGYVDELELRPNGLSVRDSTELQPVESALVDYQFRFEGPSDPADEAIVLGVRDPVVAVLAEERWSALRFWPCSSDIRASGLVRLTDISLIGRQRSKQIVTPT